MSDEKLRGLERRWRRSGEGDDLEALLRERRRVGDPEPYQDCRAALNENPNDSGARQLLARENPLAWTGTVAIEKQPTEEPSNFDPPMLIVREGKETYRVNLPIEYTRMMELGLGYAGGTLAVVGIEFPYERARNFRYDITRDGITEQQQTRTNVWSPLLSTDHVRGSVLTPPLSNEGMPVHVSENATLMVNTEYEQTVPGVWIRRGTTDEAIRGTAGNTPWIYEDGTLSFADFHTLGFNNANGPHEAYTLMGASYGPTRVPAWSRLASGQNIAATDADLSSVFDSSLARIVVEVPITILNTLRGMREEQTRER